MADEPELEKTEAIYDALDGGDPDRALVLVREAIREFADDPVLRFLCGRALMELDRPCEAVVEFDFALAVDPEDPEFRVYAAWALFRACRFDEADRTLTGGAGAPDSLPEAHFVRALLRERQARPEEAEREFERAAEMDPEWFPPPTRVTADEFDRRLTAAREALGEPFARHLDRVDVIVDDVPSDELLLESDPPLDPEQLLGMFVGVPLDEQSSFSAGGELPPRIYLFKRNLERYVAGPEQLAEQIRVTLYHELGHYLGMDEQDLEQVGYD